MLRGQKRPGLLTWEQLLHSNINNCFILVRITHLNDQFVKLLYFDYISGNGTE